MGYYQQSTALIMTLVIIIPFTSCWTDPPVDKSDFNLLQDGDFPEVGCPASLGYAKNVTAVKLAGVWFVPYYSSYWYLHLTSNWHPGHTKLRHQRHKMPCLQTVLTPIFKFFGDPQEISIWLIQAICPSTGMRFIIPCLPVEEDSNVWNCKVKDDRDSDPNNIMYVVDTDYKSWALIVRCFPFRGKDWAILSRKPDISESLKIKLLSQVSSLGFSIPTMLRMTSTC